MKPEPQNPAPVNPETADSHFEAEGHADSNPREPQEPPTQTGGNRDGWRAYFPAAVRKTLRRRDEESQCRETFEKVQARFAKTLLVPIFVFLWFCGDCTREYLHRCQAGATPKRVAFFS